MLVYHRVRPRGLDPWNPTIDPEIFAGQMEVLARDWSPTSLAELVDGFGRRRLPERSVAVTFDDGYADNLEVAAPILLEHGIPTTLFVAAELIDAGGPLWWDELAALLLEPARLPATLTLSSGNGNQWSIPSVAVDEPSAAVSPQPWEATPGTRLRAFYEVWLALRELDAPTREAALEEIAEWADAPRPSGRVLLTWEQLREFAAIPGFGLGAHTLTHPALPNCSLEDARAEIAGCADRLRERVGVEVEHFAYPFGAWNQSIARLVAELGFRAAYTTDGNAISWTSSPHALPRVPAEGHAPREFGGQLAALSRRVGTRGCNDGPERPAGAVTPGSLEVNVLPVAVLPERHDAIQHGVEPSKRPFQMTAEQVVPSEAHQQELRVGHANAEMAAQRVDFLRCEWRLLRVAALGNAEAADNAPPQEHEQGISPVVLVEERPGVRLHQGTQNEPNLSERLEVV